MQNASLEKAGYIFTFSVGLEEPKGRALPAGKTRPCLGRGGAQCRSPEANRNPRSRGAVGLCLLTTGRLRCGRAFRVRLYEHLIDEARRVRLELEVALCLEEPEVWAAMDEHRRLGRCNSIL